MTTSETPGTKIDYDRVPPGSLLDIVLRGLDVNFALSQLREGPVVGDRQKRIIELRFGLLDGKSRMQKEVAKHLGRAASTIAREEMEAMITMKRLRDGISPEMVFPRREIFSIDRAYLIPPHKMRRYIAAQPVALPEYRFPDTA